MRNPPAAATFTEEVANLLKRKINSTVTQQDELSIAFDYEGDVTGEDAEEILGKIVAVHRRAMQAAEVQGNLQQAEALRLFPANLEKAFYGFEPDFFEQNLLRVVNDV